MTTSSLNWFHKQFKTARNRSKVGSFKGSQERKCKHLLCKRWEWSQTKWFASILKLLKQLLDLRISWSRLINLFMVQNLKILLKEISKSMSLIKEELNKLWVSLSISMMVQKGLKPIWHRSSKECLISGSEAMLQEDHRELLYLDHQVLAEELSVH